MRGVTTRRLCAMLMGVVVATAHASDMTPEQRRAEMSALKWAKGPSNVGIGGKAHLAIPQGHGFLGENDSPRFLELTGNLPSPGESILVSQHWWAAFDFAGVGYVKDDEKLDPDELLKQLKGNDGPANEERRKRGLPEMHTLGWVVPPHYDAQTKHLEWGLKLQSQDSDEPIVNYTVRLLGRTGYENVILVSRPESMEQDVKDLKVVLQSFDFDPGEKYSEFRSGDRVAEFGLGALVVGGATAALVKTGFWKTIALALVAAWKLVAAAAVAALAAIGKFFRRDKSA